MTAPGDLPHSDRVRWRALRYAVSTEMLGESSTAAARAAAGPTLEPVQRSLASRWRPATI